MESQELTFETSGRNLVDVTGEVKQFCRGKGDGLVHLFAPHATAGLALMETGSGSEPDLDELLARLLPRDDRYTHSHGSTGHGADHLLLVLVSPSLSLLVFLGEPALGTWQRVEWFDLNVEIAEIRVR